MSQLFSHLRVSSEYSISQGLLTIDQIVKNAEKYSSPSVALTDQSNMFGLVKFFNKCEAAGIKPISGASIRVIFENYENAYELLCLAKTNAGHKNLMKVISNAHNNNSFKNMKISNEYSFQENEFQTLQKKYETTLRGLYSGAIGYIKPNKDFDFNVVIRSVFYNQLSRYHSFMVGGAITIDSDPELEYEECLAKAKSIFKVLEK